MGVLAGFSKSFRLMAQSALKRCATKLFTGRYTMHFPSFLRIYSPWYDGGFQQNIYMPACRFTLLTEDRCYILYSLVGNAVLLDGDLAECGVYKGGSAWIMAKALSESVGSTKPTHKLYLFDTFTGMPATYDCDALVHSEGDFGDTSIESVKKLLSQFDFVEPKPGYIPETFQGLERNKFSFVHIDVDLFSSTKSCLEFFYPRLVPGGIMLFDDYGVRIYEDLEKKAVDEFFADKSEKPISLSNGQTIIVKRG
jgi:predicted O-methyltransferase YrrM